MNLRETIIIIYYVRIHKNMYIYERLKHASYRNHETSFLRLALIEMHIRMI